MREFRVRITTAAVVALVIALSATACIPATSGRMGRKTAASLAANGQRNSLSRSAAYRWSSRRLSASAIREMNGWIYRRGCPVTTSSLRILKVRYLGFDNRAHDGTLLVHRDAVSDLSAAFGRLYRNRFRIYQMDYRITIASNQYRSLSTNNTYSFECRPQIDSQAWSQHAYGRAVDINPRQNPYVRPSSGFVFPSSGAKHVDRAPIRTGMIAGGGMVESSMRGVGWRWGGRWKSVHDYMHFSSTGG